MRLSDIKKGDYIYFDYRDGDVVVVQVENIQIMNSNDEKYLSIVGKSTRYLDEDEVPQTIEGFNDIAVTRRTLTIWESDFENGDVKLMYEDNISRYRKKVKSNANI